MEDVVQENSATQTEPVEEKPIKKSQSLNLPVNTVSTLAYASGFLPYLGWITGVLVLFMEREKQVRFHALQAIAIFGVLAIGQVVFSRTVIFSQIESVLILIQFLVWLILVYRTYMQDDWVVPYAGDWAKKQIG